MLILGHRGAVDARHPENTLAAVDRALRLGADGVEVDVRLSLDGTLMCSHDPGLRRTAGLSREVATMSDDELAQVRLSGHRLALLDDVADLVRGRGRLVVEMKTAPWPSGGAATTARAVAAWVDRDRRADVVVSSFDRPRLLQVRLGSSSARTALLSRPGVPLVVALRRALADGHAEAHVHVLSLLTASHLVARARGIGLAVTGWTVDRPSHLQRLAAAGVDAVISDDPAAARGHVFSPPLEQTG